MYEELLVDLPDLDAFLERIGYDGPVEPTLEVLDNLVYAYLTHVPFECLDVRDKGLIPDLGVEALFDKIVTRHRGGYCFEMNGLFTAALRAIGFECDSIAARIILRNPMPYISSHRGIVVHIDGQRHWADVGFGGPAPAISVPVDSHEVRHTPTGDFRVIRDGKWNVLQIFKNGAWGNTIAFDDNPAEECDFVVSNFWTSRGIDSRFRAVRMVNLLTATGSKSIEENVFRIRENGVLTEREYDPETELAGILNEHFGIEFEL